MVTNDDSSDNGLPYMQQQSDCTVRGNQSSEGSTEETTPLLEDSTPPAYQLTPLFNRVNPSTFNYLKTCRIPPKYVTANSNNRLLLESLSAGANGFGPTATISTLSEVRKKVTVDNALALNKRIIYGATHASPDLHDKVDNDEGSDEENDEDDDDDGNKTHVDELAVKTLSPSDLFQRLGLAGLPETVKESPKSWQYCDKDFSNYKWVFLVFAIIWIWFISYSVYVVGKLKTAPQWPTNLFVRNNLTGKNMLIQGEDTIKDYLVSMHNGTKRIRYPVGEGDGDNKSQFFQILYKLVVHMFRTMRYILRFSFFNK